MPSLCHQERGYLDLFMAAWPDSFDLKDSEIQKGNSVFEMVRIEVGGRSLLDTSNGNGINIRRRSARRGSRVDEPVRFDWTDTRPRLLVTSDTPDFDTEVLTHFQEEGYQIAYLPHAGDDAAYHKELEHLADPLEAGETYGIVVNRKAYGDAAALCLEACMKPMPKLCAIVAYYPSHTPNTSADFPPSLNLQVHLAGSQNFGTRHPAHYYPDTKPGFAESDLDEYDAVAARVAWSRTLGALRRGFGIYIDLEPIWDHHTALEFETRDAAATMKTMVAQPYVNHVPTMTGGIGHNALHRFYRDFFIPGNPPSLQIKLLSRTAGTDRIVDEMLVTFRHTDEIPWMLPGVPPTDREVEVVLVSVVCIRGTKLYHEHIHWDQATVLVQIGLLDPSLVPATFRTAEPGREKEVIRLPVCGREAARKVVDEHDGKSNVLIPNW